MAVSARSLRRLLGGAGLPRRVHSGRMLASAVECWPQERLARRTSVRAARKSAIRPQRLDPLTLAVDANKPRRIANGRVLEGGLGEVLREHLLD
jgi:hypothetical protein